MPRPPSRVWVLLGDRVEQAELVRRAPDGRTATYRDLAGRERFRNWDCSQVYPSRRHAERTLAAHLITHMRRGG